MSINGLGHISDHGSISMACRSMDASSLRFISTTLAPFSDEGKEVNALKSTLANCYILRKDEKAFF